jgi:hypothetical protein
MSKNRRTTADVPKKEKAPRKPPAELTGEAAVQLQALGVAATTLLETYAGTTLVPNRHLHESKRYIAQELQKILKGRKVDPMVRKRERLNAKIKEAQAKLAEMESAS